MFDGQWFRSGDLFFQDDEGYYHYAGRRDDSFKSCGLWVSPVEIEQALLVHDEVAEAAVIAAANQAGLVGPKAFVKPMTGPLTSGQQTQLREQLKTRLSQQLPRYKVPQDIEIVTDFPRTATGKVARQRLREPAAAPS